MATRTRAVTKDHEVYQILRTGILTNKYSPGEALREEELCQQMNITRTPLRLALRRLEQERLVVGEPYRGCRVREINQEEIGPLFDLREVLEGLAARNVAIASNEATLARLEQLAAVCDAAAEAEKWQDYFEADKHLHWALVENGENRPLVEVLEVYNFQLKTFMLHQHYLLNIVEQLRLRSKEMANVHSNLVRAMRNGPDEAEVQARAHVRGGKEIVLKACSLWNKSQTRRSQ